MEVLLAAALVALILAVIALAWLVTRQQSAKKREAEWDRNVQSALASNLQAVSGQLTQATQTVLQQLGQVNSSLQSGLASSSELVSKAQAAVATELHNSQEVLSRVGKQLGEVQQAGRDLSNATQTLQTVLSGAKTRGSLGEIALEALLADALPSSAYETQYRFSTGAIVDAVVHCGDRITAIDSKFPLESYRRLVDCGEDARKEFFQAVRKHAESIAEKYVLQDEGTLDLALMFVPSEGVYYELLMTSDGKFGRLDDYCRSKRIFAVSPNTLHAYLSTILIGLKGMQVAENARHLLAELSGLQVQMESFGKLYETLGGHLRRAQQCYDEADSKLDRLQDDVKTIAQGNIADARAGALETTSKL